MRLVRSATKERQAVAAYVRDRIQREAKTHGRGRLAAVATATGFTTAQVSNVHTGQRAAGPNFALAIARYWGITYDQLVETAVSWARSHAVDAHPTVRRFRDRPEWELAVAGARGFYADIPAERFSEVGAIVNTADRIVDARFVGDLARALHELDQRGGGAPPRSGTETTPTPTSEDEEKCAG